MATNEDGPAPKRRRKRAVHWSAATAKRLCKRVAAGELLYVVLRDETMPTPQVVARWGKARPEFGAELKAARAAGGRAVRANGTAGGGVSTYCDGVAGEVFERLCEGESLTAIGKDPTMPSMSTLFYWRRQRPEFEDTVRLAKEIQAEQACERADDLAEAATPESAYLTHVQLTHLRWKTGVLAPKTFRTKLADPPVQPKMVSILTRVFKVEMDPETGQRKVVAYCPNPFTGQVEREDAPGWRPPGDETYLPMPGGRGGR